MPYYQTISYHQAAALLHSGHCRIVDVREPEEYLAGHLNGAINIPLHTLTRRAPLLLPSRGRPILVYCAEAARSLPAVQVLSYMGYTQLYQLRGGYCAGLRFL